MKKLLTMLTAICMILGLAACAKSESNTTTTTAKSTTTASTTVSEAVDTTEEKKDSIETEASSSEVVTEDTTMKETENTQAHKEVLVVYFSATGNTRGVAEKIASVEDADIYEIVPAEPYSDADLNWNDSSSRSTKEQNDSSSRPKIGSDTISLDGYKKIYIGYPIWWGEEPRILDTFVESYSFDGITMIPFCTSGGSGIGRSGKNLEENAGSGTWLDGKRLNTGASEDSIRSWIEGLK